MCVYSLAHFVIVLPTTCTNSEKEEINNEEREINVLLVSKKYLCKRRQGINRVSE